MNKASPSIAVVIPCFRVGRQILDVIARVGPEVGRIFVIDDACPEHTGDLVERECADPRVSVVRHPENRGVGGAMVTGYRAALDAGAEIIVKVDGDGQMNPALIPQFAKPLIMGQADYTKGNRFYDLESLRAMPRVRLFGNAMLSMVNKISSGYWDIMDPTNGYTAIHHTALARLPLAKIDRGYFFESDMLLRLYTVRAVVRDVPMASHYADESSNLRVGRVLVTFPLKYLRSAAKRIFYSYFLRDFNAGTLQLLGAIMIGGAGAIYGIIRWVASARSGIAATSGEVMIAALPVLVGIQFLLAALQFDIQNVPREPIQEREG
ncbi:MAG: glycosyltransferase family 2 protein [Casimicrobiaceae bacterium]